jgi:hypothetical protein
MKYRMKRVIIMLPSLPLCTSFTFQVQAAGSNFQTRCSLASQSQQDIATSKSERCVWLPLLLFLVKACIAHDLSFRLSRFFSSFLRSIANALPHQASSLVIFRLIVALESEFMRTLLDSASCFHKHSSIRTSPPQPLFHLYRVRPPPKTVKSPALKSVK